MDFVLLPSCVSDMTFWCRRVYLFRFSFACNGDKVRRPYPETRGVLVNFNLPGGPYPEAIIEGLGRPCPYPEAIIEGRGQPDPYPEAIIEGRGRPDPYPEAIIEGRGRPGALSRNGKGISKFQSTPYPETGGYW